MSNSKQTYANFYQVAYPVYFLSQMYGFYPFSIQYNARLKTNTVVISYKNILRSVFALIVYVYGILSLFIKDNSEIKGIPLLIIYVARLTISGVMISAIFTVISGMINSKQIAFVLKEINQIDAEVRLFLLFLF